jgi:hypothetical protein
MAATTEGSDDGWLRLWLDGELVLEHVEVSNYGLGLERVEMSYDGQGQRLSQTVHEGGTSLTTHNTLDSQAGQRPLPLRPRRERLTAWRSRPARRSGPDDGRCGRHGPGGGYP